MKNIGDISEPFKSDYGWHIIKLYEKTPLEPFEDAKRDLELRVKRDSRSKLINSSMSKTLREKYKVSYQNNELSYFQELIDDSYFNKSWSIPETLQKDKNLVTIGNKIYTYLDFANHLKVAQKEITIKLSPQDLISTQYQAFIDKEVIAYHEENFRI